MELMDEKNMMNSSTYNGARGVTSKVLIALCCVNLLLWLGILAYGISSFNKMDHRLIEISSRCTGGKYEGAAASQKQSPADAEMIELQQRLDGLTKDVGDLDGTLENLDQFWTALAQKADEALSSDEHNNKENTILPSPDQVVQLLACQKGAPGVPGRPGMDGLSGPRGLKGMTGSKGFPGEMGFPGMKGDPGIPGFDGLRGLPGISGPKGDAGIPGLDGMNGDHGMPGLDGEGLVGPKGDPGFDGFPGMDGMKGEKGEVGADGFDGLTGLKGMKGEPGMPGSKGESGLPGRR